MAHETHILITGASRGIGAAIAREYAGPGTRLSLTGRDHDLLEAVAADCRARGADVAIHLQDVRDGDALARWIAAMDSEYPLDMVIANAGITGGVTRAGDLEDWARMDKLIQINLASAIRTGHAAATAMLERGRGRIVLISSLAGLRGLPSSPTYSAAKAGLLAWGEAMRGLLKRRGVSVHVVCPGYVDTELSRQYGGNKPLVMTVEQAARRIRRGLARNRAVIAFPWPLAFGLWLLRLMPAFLSDFFIAGFATYRRGEGEAD